MSLSDAKGTKGTRGRTEGEGQSPRDRSRSKSPFRPTPTGDEPLPSNAAQQLVGVDWRTGAGPSSSTQDITNPLGKRKRPSLASEETEQTHSPNPEEKRRPEKRTRLVEAPGRSTTPDGEPPRGSLDFATMHRTSGVSRTTDFAPEYGTLQAEWERYKEWELVGKGNEIRVLEPLDPSFDCHFLTFFDGRTPSDKYTSDENFPARYVEEEFSLLGSRDDYRNDSSLYKDLADRLRDRPNHYIAVYRVDGTVIPLHTSPVKGVYQKENGEYSIMLWGKWGRGPILTHDIENVPPHYKDGDEANWEIRVTDREKGRIMDL